MDAMQLANSLPMWLACGTAVLLVVFQAVIFTKKAMDAAPKVGLTNDQVKRAMKSSALTSLGPSVVILSGMLSLLVSVGGPMAWMRLSFIGSVMFESIAAGIGTASAGVQLGVDEMTTFAFTMAVWTMILGSIGWIIVSTLTADKMETPIPMVEMMEPCSDPSSTPAETWAILAQGTRMLEIFPERNAM